MKELLAVSVAALSMVLWVWLVAPVIIRALGVPMAIAFWRHGRDNRLTTSQYVWAYGVFGFGGGLFLFNTLGYYLRRSLLGEQFSRSTLWHLVVNLAVAICIGLLFGVITVRAREVEEKKG